MTMRANLYAILLALAAAAGCLPEEKPVTQPIEFNHRVHVEKNDIPCTDCHTGAASQAHAGLPSLQQCLLCHMKPQGNPPSEKEHQVRKLAAEGFKLRWNQVTRNEGHVYFSHRAHVSVAKMSCTECHGDVSHWEKPPETPNWDLMDMMYCMDCHRKRGTTNGCRVCHK